MREFILSLLGEREIFKVVIAVYFFFAIRAIFVAKSESHKLA